MKAINLTKSQIETIVLEAIQAGATALAQQVDVEHVAKEVSTLMKTEGENLIQSISLSAMQRYGNKK
jgi:DNA-binding NarL/FixJ family response regulator